VPWTEGSWPTATPETVAPLLARAGLPAELVDALEDRSWDDQIQAETDEELGLTGKDVIGLAGFGGFAELKRSLRELPQLPAFGGGLGRDRRRAGLARR
jgi:hypothetical protein